MLVHAHGFAINRGIADHVRVELDVRGGLPTFSIIGLGGAAARDARERVHAAILNSGFAFPRRRLTVNLAPAVCARAAPAFDLALACCVLASEGEIDGERLGKVGLFAALGLGGDLRGHECVGLAAEAAADATLAGLIVARADQAEARAAGGPPVAALASLRQVVALFAGGGGRRAEPVARRAARALRSVPARGSPPGGDEAAGAETRSAAESPRGTRARAP
jgi:magnesium chelatase family protein